MKSRSREKVNLFGLFVPVKGSVNERNVYYEVRVIDERKK